MKANIWKRVYDEEHANLTYMRLCFEVEKKRADRLETAVTAAQKFSEVSARATELKRAEYDRMITILREKLKEFPENMPVAPTPHPRGFSSPSRSDQLLHWLKTVWTKLNSKP
jgi:hypothetical protein